LDQSQHEGCDKIMPCYNTVPISIIPPTSQGVGPLVWQNGSQINRLNIPLNPSLVIYDGSVTRFGDGSAQSPIYLPNIQQFPSNSIVAIIAKNSIGQLISIQATVGSANSGGTGYRQLIVPN